MTKFVVTTLKLGLPAALFGYLLWSVPSEDYRAFANQPKRWELLLAAQCLALVAVMISFVRWRFLVLAFGIPFTLREAMRLGFLGYLLNFVSFGSVGGDVFKAILVARDKREKRPEAVASVLLDRAIGLLGLLLLTWLSLFFLSDASMTPLLIGIRRAAGVLSLVALSGLAVGLLAGRWFDRWIDWVGHIPVLGETLARMSRAVRALRSRPLLLPMLTLLALAVHTLLATTVFLISWGIYAEHPTLKQHLMVVPPSMAAGTLPLAPGGIGVQEGALAGLFQQLPQLPQAFSGMLVATVYRLITITITGVGVIFYLASHHREFEFVQQEHLA